MTASAPVFARAATLLTSARSVVIGSHIDPDGDAIGSSLALAEALDLVGVPVTVVSANGPGCPRTYTFLPGADRIVPAVGVPVPELFVALDSPVLARLGDARPLAESADHLLLIDHHPDASMDATVALVDSDAAATGLLVWRLIPHLGVARTLGAAMGCYAALLSDTGRFSYSNTTPDALRAAAEMIDAGVDPHAVYSAIYENRSPGAHALVVRTLERATRVNNGHVLYSWISDDDFRETGALPPEAENLIDQLRPLAGPEVVFLLKIGSGVVRASLRAARGFDVGAVARQFGGGGHRAAAGLTYEGSVDGLLAELLPRLPGGA